MDDYEKYEAECRRIKRKNKRILKDFEVWLKKSNLKNKTIAKHLRNIDFYINRFLLYSEATEAKNGASAISVFLGYWFIKKASWSSKAHIISNAASLKKFYIFLFDAGMICRKDLDFLKSIIKEEMPEWLATMERYDDPSITDMEEVWRI